MTEKVAVPAHIAIIMDGNGRWAKERGLPRKSGHQAGAEAVRECIEACKQVGVRYLTLYAFSSENWSRPESEISALMLLLERFLAQKTAEMMQQNVKLQAIGDLSKLPNKTRLKLEEAIAKTSKNTSLTLILALSYGGREEIVHATQALVAQAAKGELQPEQVSKDLFARNLYTADYPDPDLLIRTSGEFRVSNFLLWQISYAEIVILKKYWPDFTQADLFAAVDEYSCRHRRFGAL